MGKKGQGGGGRDQDDTVQLPCLSHRQGTGRGGSRTRALPGHCSTSRPYPLAVSSVQSEPQGDGTALPPGDGLHSVRVFGAGGKAHGPSALGLHLCLKGTKGNTGQTDLPSEGTWGPQRPRVRVAPQPSFPKTRLKSKGDQRSDQHSKAPWLGGWGGALATRRPGGCSALHSEGFCLSGMGTRTHSLLRSWHPVQ